LFFLAVCGTQVAKIVDNDLRFYSQRLDQGQFFFTDLAAVSALEQFVLKRVPIVRAGDVPFGTLVSRDAFPPFELAAGNPGLDLIFAIIITRLPRYRSHVVLPA